MQGAKVELILYKLVEGTAINAKWKWSRLYKPYLVMFPDLL